MALKTNPGFLASSTVHGVALLFLLLNVSSAPKFEDTPESVAVETITTSELNQIMNGEKTAKPMRLPQRRADKIADVADPKPLPPLAEAKKDVPLPPSPDKPREDPGHDDAPVPTPPERVAALPPPTPAPEPTPPQRPVEKVETPTPPQRPAPEPPKSVEDKPPPDDAETIEPKPPVRPKVEPRKEAKTEPKTEPKIEPKTLPTPVTKPPEKKPVKEVKAPEPPKRLEPPKKPEPRLKLDELAKLLEDKKSDKPAAKPKAGNEAKEEPRPRDFDPHSISALLDREAPQRKASTGRTLTQVASLGAPTAHAATLSPSMMAQLDQILIDQYHGCWSYFGLGGAQKYIPEVRVHLAQDGSLVGQPALLNPPADPNLRSLADSAIRAVQKCNPMKIPDRFAPYYEAWAKRVVRFNPEDLL